MTRNSVSGGMKYQKGGIIPENRSNVSIETRWLLLLREPVNNRTGGAAALWGVLEVN